MIVTLPEKSILDLRIDLVRPLLGTLRSLAIFFNLGLRSAMRSSAARS
jgi:hypothetical protein